MCRGRSGEGMSECEAEAGFRELAKRNPALFDRFTGAANLTNPVMRAEDELPASEIVLRLHNDHGDEIELSGNWIGYVRTMDVDYYGPYLDVRLRPSRFRPSDNEIKLSGRS